MEGKHEFTLASGRVDNVGTKGKPLSPENLAGDFGSEAELAQDGIRALYAAIVGAADPQALTCFSQWKILFGRVCGYNVEDPSPKIEKLAGHYGLPAQGLKPAELLFAVHSYYAIFLKLLASEILAFFHRLPTPLQKMTRAATSRKLKVEMEALEAGSIFRHLNITNYPDGDLFAWYTAVWSDTIEDFVRKMVARLGNYNPGTLSADPAGSRDLVKRLYQQLFPKSVRHDLGEYYTPDWLAEHVLDELRYAGDPEQRLLDPACGSGTFLVMAINRIRRWYEKNRDACRFSEAGLCRKILSNVIGFDLNPLAVMAARTNYLIAIRDLIPHRDTVEVPVYLCDAILTPFEYGGVSSVSKPFAPLFVGTFDYVAGNPPWINWRNLPSEYRAGLIPIWERYGLFNQKGLRARLGSGMDDLSVLMTYVSSHAYLRTGGQLGFVIPQTLFQSIGGGQGFRRFSLPTGLFLEVKRVHDFSSFQPFEGAMNRTATIVLRVSDSLTSYPVEYVRVELRDPSCVPEHWSPSPEGPFVLTKLEATPIAADKTSPWCILPQGMAAAVERIRGESTYVARIGAHSGGAAGVYWIDVQNREGAYVLIANRWDAGRNKYDAVTASVESQLVRPLVRGRDVRRWTLAPSLSILIPYDEVNDGKAVSEARMKREFPRTFEYFRRFKTKLIKRPHYLQHFQASGAPFWSMYNVGNYTFAAARVVWREQSSSFQCAVIEGDSKCNPVADAKLIVVPCGSADEAHYLAAVLNSSPARFLIDSYVVNVQISTHVLKHVAVAQFSAKNPVHVALARHSRLCHAAAGAGQVTQLARLEGELDILAAGLWELSGRQLAQIQAYVRQGQCDEGTAP